MKLAAFNQLTSEQAKQSLIDCCSSGSWVAALLAARPFNSRAELKETADQIWKSMREKDYLEAFEGHPQIGDVKSLKKKYASTEKLASGEQSLVKQADDDLLLKLSQANKAYLEKFGFIFIVCATGKSAQQMLDLLLARLANNRQQELANAAEEQRKIFQLRINKLFEEQL